MVGALCMKIYFKCLIKKSWGLKAIDNLNEAILRSTAEE